MSQVRTIQHHEWECNRTLERDLRLHPLYELAFDAKPSEKGTQFLDTVAKIRPVKSRQVAAGLLAMASVL